MTVARVHDRELSCFFVRELLPLYLERQLDSVRVEQITHHLKGCEKCQAIFNKTKRARQILEDLSDTQAQASLVEYLKKEHHFWIDFFERAGWRRWPSTLKWAVELSAVALTLVVVIHWFPWLNFAKQMYTMRAAQVAAISPTARSTPAVTTVASDDVSTEGEEEPAFKPSSSTTTTMAAKNRMDDQGPLPQPPRPKTLAAAGLGPSPSPLAKNSRDDQDAATAAEENAAGVADAQAGSSEGEKVGYVWRGTLKVEELTDDLAEKVTRVVSELGGIKAGQVELGWRREGQRYYHFILPEENYEKLLSALNGEGILTLNREVHPRVIKEGHMRIIMTLEEDQ